MTPTVKVTLTNKRAYITSISSDDLFDALKKEWSFAAPGAYYSPAYRQGHWDGRISWLKNGSIPSGLFRATKEEASTNLGVRFKVTEDLQSVSTLPGLPPNTDPRYFYQDVCIEEAIKALPYGGGVILSATGSGKTATMAKLWSKLPYYCLFVVDQLDLLYQSQKEIQMWLGKEVGVVGNSEFIPKQYTVATIQTLQKHKSKAKFKEWYKKIKVITLDELHKMMSRRNFPFFQKSLPNVIAMYGLTATLQMKKKLIRQKVYSICGPIIFSFPISEGVESGVLSEGEVLQLLLPWKRCYDYSVQELYKIQVIKNSEKHLACVELVAKAINEWGSHVAILVERIAHLTYISSALTANKIKHRVFYGAIKTEERQSHMRRMEKENLQVIVANQVFTKGINIKRLDVIVDLSERANPDDVMQKYGRGVRLHDNKTSLTYVTFNTQGGRDNELGLKQRKQRRIFIGNKIKVTTKEVQDIDDCVASFDDFMRGERWTRKTPPKQQRLKLSI